MIYIKKIQYYFVKYLWSKIGANYKVNYKEKGILNFIDICSFGGLPEPWLSNANKVKYLVNFEPNDKIKETKNITTFNTAVWSKEEEKDFYIYKGFRGTGSSLFQQNYNYVKDNFLELSKKGSQKLANSWFKRSQVLKTLKIQCNTLDNLILNKFSDKNFDFIKIDAQGAELDILKGGDRILNNCIGLHLELFTIPLYKDIPLLPEVESYLSEKGFKLIKKMGPHGTFHSQNDCIFLKLDADPMKLTLIKNIYQINF